MNERRNILLSYYGDDFTGSGDVMEVLSQKGIPTILFLSPPDKQEIEKFCFKNRMSQDINQVAYGVAGIARSLGPKEMEEELTPIFERISKIPSQYFHYKICSTLDSSPEVGNIGVALKVADKYFKSKFIPLIIGFPTLNRFVVFGNLFARIRDIVYRLDRHPVMSKHPVTPMDESDIRLHLKKQTDRQIHLVDIMHLEKLEKLLLADLLDENDQDSTPLLLFDTLENHQLNNIGKWLHEYSQNNHQVLLGSSAVEYALGHIYGSEKEFESDPVAVNPVLIVSGSCAQNTADQIRHVQELGYKSVRIEVNKLFISELSQIEMDRVRDEALMALREGENTVIYSALGPNDSFEKPTPDQIGKFPHQIAESQAWITSKIIEKFPLKRLVTAGGDTSGYILKSLDIEALEFAGELAPGSPLCTAHSKNPKIDGIEIAIKGGQNGTVRYMEFAQKGGIVP